MPKELFYRRLKLFIQHYKDSADIDLNLLLDDQINMSAPDNIVVFGKKEKFSNCYLLKEANNCKYHQIIVDTNIDVVIKSSLDLTTDTIIIDLDEYGIRGMQLDFTLRLMCP